MRDDLDERFKGAAMATDAKSSADGWWDWRLYGQWVPLNAAAFAIIPLVGVVLEQLASTATKNLVHNHRAIAVLIIAVIGAALQGTLLGRWQWRLLRRRVPDLQRRRWVLVLAVHAVCTRVGSVQRSRFGRSWW
jgi:hypothetical protein